MALCGVLPEERTRRQPFEIDVDVFVDLSRGRHDRCARRHGRLRGAVRTHRRRSRATSSTALLERFAARVAEVVLATTSGRRGHGQRPQAATSGAAALVDERRVHPPHEELTDGARVPRVWDPTWVIDDSILRDAVAAIPDVVAVSPRVRDRAGRWSRRKARISTSWCSLETEHSPRELLEICRACEAEAQRVRTVRWGPRTLDVDVLWVDGQTVDEPDLVVPHPRMFERAFVLMPLRDVAADLIPPSFVDPRRRRSAGARSTVTSAIVSAWSGRGRAGGSFAEALVCGRLATRRRLRSGGRALDDAAVDVDVVIIATPDRAIAEVAPQRYDRSTRPRSCTCRERAASTCSRRTPAGRRCTR